MTQDEISRAVEAVKQSRKSEKKQYRAGDSFAKEYLNRKYRYRDASEHQRLTGKEL